VPNTVAAVQKGNAQLPAHSDQRINLVGFAVGNGYTDWQLDFNANVPNGRYHALTSHKRFVAAQKACGGDFARCFWPRKDVPCPKECDAAVQAAVQDAMDGSIDIYDIYEDVCLKEGEERLPTQAFTLWHERQTALATLRASAAVEGQHGRRARATISPIFPTCIDQSSARYLNNRTVQDAIHVRPGTVPNGKWSDCGNVKYDFNYASELPRYRQWVAEGELQMLIYNGDADYILSHMGNSAWIHEGLKLNTTREWTKWRGSDGQVAGYFEEFATAGKPLTFLTVKGAGHMVPRDRPLHALNMLTQFLAGGGYDKVGHEKSTAQPLCPK
jgi:hypothetical protein